jgi:integrase
MGVKVREKPEGSGIYWVYIDHKGQRKAKKIGRSLQDAEKVAKKIEARLTLGELGLLAKAEAKEKPNFKDYAEHWLETYIKPLRRRSTYERYRDIMSRHLLPALGKKQIDQIKRTDIRDLILSKSKAGLSRSMISLIRDVISGPMGYAVEDEIIPGNPVSGILKRLQLERCVFR